MPIKYNKLFALLAMKGLKGKDLKEMAGLSAPTMSKLNKGESVTTETIARICKALQCDVGDIMEYTSDDTE